MVVGDERYVTTWPAVWRRATKTDEAPVAWGRFLLGLFPEIHQRARAGEAWAFMWHGYYVIRIPVKSVPDVLRTRIPDVSDWDAYLLYRGPTPVAIALGPAGVVQNTAGKPTWIAVLLDDLVGEIARPEYVLEEWTIRPRLAATAR
jgi:hypothetical protein